MIEVLTCPSLCLYACLLRAVLNYGIFSRFFVWQIIGDKRSQLGAGCTTQPANCLLWISAPIQLLMLSP